jgi:hypothetical protein
MFHPERLFQVYAEFVCHQLSVQHWEFRYRADSSPQSDALVSPMNSIHILTTQILKVYCNIILSPLSRSANWHFPHQGYQLKFCISHPSNDCYMARQTHLSGFNGVNTIWRRILIIMLLTPASVSKPCFLFWVKQIYSAEACVSLYCHLVGVAELNPNSYIIYRHDHSLSLPNIASILPHCLRHFKIIMNVRCNIMQTFHS